MCPICLQGGSFVTVKILISYKTKPKATIIGIVVLGLFSKLRQVYFLKYDSPWFPTRDRSGGVLTSGGPKGSPESHCPFLRAQSTDGSEFNHRRAESTGSPDGSCGKEEKTWGRVESVASGTSVLTTGATDGTYSGRDRRRWASVSGDR